MAQSLYFVSGQRHWMSGIHRWWDHHTLTSLSLGAFGLLLALAYIVGIVVVQMTYFFPTQWMIKEVRRSRYRDLHAINSYFEGVPVGDAPTKASSSEKSLEERLEPKVETSAQQSLEERLEPKVETSAQRLLALSFSLPDDERYGSSTLLISRLYESLLTNHLKGPKEGVWPPPNRVRHAESLALTMGRSLANAEIADEYKYRRANRQIFVGIIPGWTLAAAAGTLAMGHKYGWAWWPVLGCVTVAGIWALAESAFYQERISQALILDIAFLHLRHAADSTTSGDVE